MKQIIFESEVETTLNGVRDLRHQLIQVIEPIIHNSTLRNQIAVCVTEAANNVVIHGLEQAACFRFMFGKSTKTWWVELSDTNRQWNMSESSRDNSFDMESETGRGQSIIQSMSDSVEYLHTEKAEYGNTIKITWQRKPSTGIPQILIVEDDNALNRLYCRYLNGEYQIHSAQNGKEALEILACAKVDLIISDIRMPEIDGLQLRQEIAKHHSNDVIPFVYLTASSDPWLKQQASEMGIDDYLVKPIRKEDLTSTINRVLARTRQVYKQLTQRIGKRIATSLAPQLPQHSHGWNICVASRNTGIGGGDVVLHTNSDDALTLMLLDIMGHDDSAKFFSYAYAGYIRGIMQSQAPDTAVNRLLQSISDSAFSDSLLSQSMLTCLGIQLYDDGKIQLSSAGHPPPLLISDKGVNNIDIGGVLPGLHPTANYALHTTDIKEGERLALYTDGLFESSSIEDVRYAHTQALISAFTQSANAPIDVAIKDLMAIFDKNAGIPPKDDATLILIERSGTTH